VAYQLEVIRFRDLLVVQSIPRFVPGLSPPTLEIKGEDLSSATRVLINDSDVPEFMIVDKQTIYAQVPENVGRISTIEIVSSEFTRTAIGSKLSFEVGNKTRKVDGVLKLVQLFTKWVLQSPGSDVFHPSRGGGLQQLAGRVSTTKDMQPIYASITRSVDTTTAQIRTAQANQTDLPLSERLYSATLVDISIHDQTMTALAQVRLVSMAGGDAVAALQL
jgi:hypothetical protein